MALVAVRYLGDESRNGLNHIEDWYLPADAFKTKFVDGAGRTLYLVGTVQQISAECSRLDVAGAIHHHYGHTFHYKGRDERKAPVLKKIEPSVKAVTITKLKE